MAHPPAQSTVATGAARADEADGSQYVVKGSRTRVEGQAQAATVSITAASNSPARVAAQVESGEALRQGL